MPLWKYCRNKRQHVNGRIFGSKQNEIANSFDNTFKGRGYPCKRPLCRLADFRRTKGLKVEGMLFYRELLAVELGLVCLHRYLMGFKILFRSCQTMRFLLNAVCMDTSRDKEWEFTCYKKGDTLSAGDTIGNVPEGIFTHRIMVPFSLK